MSSTIPRRRTTWPAHPERVKELLARLDDYAYEMVPAKYLEELRPAIGPCSGGTTRRADEAVPL